MLLDSVIIQFHKIFWNNFICKAVIYSSFEVNLGRKTRKKQRHSDIGWLLKKTTGDEKENKDVVCNKNCVIGFNNYGLDAIDRNILSQWAL